MRLTRKKAIEISIELWTWLAETGSEYKDDWVGWNKYGALDDDCALCAYQWQQSKANKRVYRYDECPSCPYFKKYRYRCMGERSPYIGWDETSGGDKVEDRKLYALEFLEQLRQL